MRPAGAPEDFRDGDPVRVLEGRRLLERPLRTLGDRTLEFRLAKNDRTLMPKWAEVSQRGPTIFGEVLASRSGGAPSHTPFSCGCYSRRAPTVAAPGVRSRAA